MQTKFVRSIACVALLVATSAANAGLVLSEGPIGKDAPIGPWAQFQAWVTQTK